MSADDRLRTRRSEHVALLKQLERVLQADQRIVAAWLFGSEARRTSDVLSDLDVWVIVKDESIETISAERQHYVAQLELPVLLLESPQNAPAGGAYLMALYPGQAGVHQVDWYWQRQADASLPRQAALLFDRGGITQDTRQEQLTNAIELIGGQVPSQAIPYVYDLFDLADALLQQEETEQVTSYRRRED